MGITIKIYYVGDIDSIISVVADTCMYRLLDNFFHRFLVEKNEKHKKQYSVFLFPYHQSCHFSSVNMNKQNVLVIRPKSIKNGQWDFMVLSP